ncbi:MAG: porin family protein [Bacteroidota bacterium]
MRFLFAIILLSSILPLSAQFSVQMPIGLSIGSPIGPIPEGSTGVPGTRLWGGVMLEYRFAERLAIRAGLSYASKASEYVALVRGQQQAEANVLGTVVRLPFQFDYEATVRGRFANRYLQLPLLLVWHNQSRFRPYGGPYLAYNIRPYHRGRVDVVVEGGLIEIRNQAFDETAGLRSWDAGLMLGTDFSIIGPLAISLQFQCGLSPLYENNPEGLEGNFRNAYLQIGFYARIE